MTVRNPRMLVWRSSMPNKREQLAGIRNRNSGSWSAMYYLQCAKVGLVFSAGNKQPFVDYPVNGSWIFTLAQAGKMLYPAARSELVRTTQGLTRKLADLDRWHRESQQLQLEQHVARRQADLDARLCSFRPVAQVEEWKAAHGGVCMRKKFLVLQGPSGLGKTEFARRLLGDAAMTFEINMAGSNDFCLRNFVPLQHRLILWDEARPQLVLQQRKLFQCPAAWIDLGASPTGALVYRVWVNDCLMVICSNNWSWLVDQCQAADAAWICANQVLVQVTTSLVRL